MDAKKVLVVGASGGIGHTTAEVLLKEGYKVIGTSYKNSDKLNDLKANDNFQNKVVDLKNLSSIRQLYESLKTEKIYALVNCSGIVGFEGGGLTEDFAIWEETIAVNLSANFYLAKLFYKSLVENGRFIMISSTDAFYGGAITASYAVSKAGVNSLTKSLSLFLKDKKVRVNSIAPGWVLTPMTQGEGEEFLGKVASINPLKRNANPEDVANLIKFLLSPDSDYINGQVITLDGGYTNQDPTLLIEEESKES